MRKLVMRKSVQGMFPTGLNHVLSQLTSINLANCGSVDIDDNCASLIALNCSKLESLALNDCNDMSITGFLQILVNCKQLTTFTAKYHVSGFFECIASHDTGLEHINISCRAISGGTLLRAVMRLPQLKTLTVPSMTVGHRWNCHPRSPLVQYRPALRSAGRTQYRWI